MRGRWLGCGSRGWGLGGERGGPVALNSPSYLEGGKGGEGFIVGVVILAVSTKAQC